MKGHGADLHGHTLAAGMLPTDIREDLTKKQTEKVNTKANLIPVMM